jgi:hypothetical protein
MCNSLSTYLRSDESFEKIYVANKIEEYCRQNSEKFFSDILPLISTVSIMSWK